MEGLRSTESLSIATVTPDSVPGRHAAGVVSDKDGHLNVVSEWNLSGVRARTAELSPSISVFIRVETGVPMSDEYTVLFAEASQMSTSKNSTEGEIVIEGSISWTDRNLQYAEHFTFEQGAQPLQIASLLPSSCHHGSLAQGADADAFHAAGTLMPKSLHSTQPRRLPLIIPSRHLILPLNPLILQHPRVSPNVIAFYL